MKSPEIIGHVHVRETTGNRRDTAVVRIGMPIGKGICNDLQRIELSSTDGRPVRYQLRPLSRWIDGTFKWLLIRASVRLEAGEALTLSLSSAPAVVSREPLMPIEKRQDGWLLNTRNGQLSFGDSCTTNVLDLNPGDWQGQLILQDDKGRDHVCQITSSRIVENGSWITSWEANGHFESHECGLLATFRAEVMEDISRIQLDVTLHNPGAATHKGGLWDLGDPGSAFFKGLKFRLFSNEPFHSLRWQREPCRPVEVASPPFSVYQDSSGGAAWDSPNHLDCRGNLTVGFRGFRVQTADIENFVDGRADPILEAATGSSSIAAALLDFWQNFPSALNATKDMIEIGLFPEQSLTLHELQGGERKRQSMIFAFGVEEPLTRVREWQLPIHVALDPVEVEESQAIHGLTSQSRDPNTAYLNYIAQIVEGPGSFRDRREIVDEYGWRNFGELFADHEAVHHRGTRPFISHYNNQYDFVHAAAVHFLRSGDFRWWTLCSEAARHHIDIDVYHTTDDKATYNGGFFWHTDHYVPAARSSHRTYSADNANADQYGGGPSSEHNYTSGFVLYYYLSGDDAAAATVVELADWVLNSDDGSITLYAVFDPGPTGAASRTLEDGYHSAGRGAGNSINACLDAFLISCRHSYLSKAEELLERCINPHDDIDQLGLLDAEKRWSYLVLLQVLVKYLNLKQELGVRDYYYHLARASLLHYADWMIRKETPFYDRLDEVEIPTETWPAHDVRKSVILYAAAHFSQDADVRTGLRTKAEFFFERCLSDLFRFETQNLTRPLVILANYGHQIAYYQTAERMEETSSVFVPYSLAPRKRFVPQASRWSKTVRARLRASCVEAVRKVRSRF